MARKLTITALMMMFGLMGSTASAQDAPQLRTLEGRQAAVNPIPVTVRDDAPSNHEIKLPEAPIVKNDVRKNMANKVQGILNEKTLKGTVSSIQIVDLDTGDVVYKHNEQKVMKPASNTKLLTTAAALNILGGDYQFESKLLARGNVVKGVLQGDLQLFIDHDFTWSNRFYETGDVPLRGMIQQLKDAGINRITGNLIVSGYVVYGGTPTATLSTPLHLRQVANQFAALMRKNKIGFKAVSIRQNAAPDGKAVAAWKSPMLSEAIVPLNRVSHNEYADMLLMAIGKKSGGKSTFESGAKAVHDWLAKENLLVKGFQQKDGSGLSHGNQMSAEFFTGLVRYMLHSKYSREYAASMSIAGYDGTYGGRLAVDDGKGRVYAKSGTLRDTISGSGFFVNRHDGHTYAFSIIVNGVRNKKLTRQSIDRILRVFLGNHLTDETPAAPQMQSFRRDDSGLVAAEWSSVKSAAGYRVYTSEDGAVWKSVFETDKTKYYMPNQAAHIRVTAVDKSGIESQPSLIFSYRPGDKTMTIVESARCRSDEAMRPSNHLMAHERPLANLVADNWGIETVRSTGNSKHDAVLFHSATCRGAIAWNAADYEKAVKSDIPVIVNIADAHLSADASGPCAPADGKVLGCFGEPVITKDRRIGKNSDNMRVRKAAGTGSSRPSSVKTWNGSQKLFAMSALPVAEKQKTSENGSISVIGFDLQAVDSRRTLQHIWKKLGIN